MKIKHVISFGIITVGMLSGASVIAADSSHLIDRGRYIVKTSGCNDCHTQRYPESGGKIAEKHWLEGNPVGFQGPWGTTYPSNLRLYMHSLTEKQWMAIARKPLRPPMPWFALRDMTDNDLRAIYAYIHQLGPAGKPAPSYAPPGVAVKTPYIEFVPKNLPQTAQAKN